VAEGAIIQFHELDAYLAVAQKPVGGALVLPMIYGLDPCVRDIANRLADFGLTTVVWNPYPGHPAIPRAEAAPRSAHLRDGLMTAQISAWLTYLQEVRKVRQVATIGFALGGRIGLLHASHDRRVTGHVSFYPSIPTPPDLNQELDPIKLSLEVRCPVQLVRPGKDETTLGETYDRLTRALRSRRGANTILEVYQDAERGFIEQDQHPGHANEMATRLSWPQAVAFMRACVSAPA
jgi:carboxymethylenebutenolidase